MARYNGVEFDENGRLVIDVTKMARPEEPAQLGPRIDVTQRPEPAVDGLMIRGGRPGEFRDYRAQDSRRAGGFGERVVATRRGADNIVLADESMRERGMGGINIIQPTTPEGSFGRIPDAAGVSGDGNVVLSQRAIDALGTRVQEDRRNPMIRINRDSPMMVEAQRKADTGGFRKGIDAENRGVMDRTTARNEQIMLQRSRPRDMMTRQNQENQIMAGADAARMTPQVMTADGVATGWDPVKQRIVTDLTGAQALGASRVKDNSLQGMTDDEVIQRKIALEARMIGDMNDMERLAYTDHIAKGRLDKAKALQDSLIRTKWSPAMQASYDDYNNEYNRRRGNAPAKATVSPAPAAGGGAAAAKGTKKSLGGVQAR